jgi:cytochrome d ubiquinol oxidase subunit II
LTTLTLFITHGAVFLALKTDGPIRTEARSLAVGVGVVAAMVAVSFLIWTQIRTGSVLSGILFLVAALALLAGLLAAWRTQEGWAFVGTFAAIAVGIAGLFAALYPDVMPSTLAGGASLTTTNAAATDYTLKIMTVVAVMFTPLVLAYQAWTYWVFHRRISVHHIPVSAAGSADAVGDAAPSAS